jgi:hypothetical protein
MNLIDGESRLDAQVVVDRNLDAFARADVVDDAAVDRDAHFFFEQERLAAQLHGVVLPEGRPAGFVLRRGGTLVLDGIDAAAFLLDDIELAGQAPFFGRQRDAARLQGVAVLAGDVLQSRVVDTAMLEEAVLDKFVRRHDGVDVFEVVQALAVAYLI